MVVDELGAPLSVAAGAVVGAVARIGAPVVGKTVDATGVELDDESSTVTVGVGPGVLPTDGEGVILATGGDTGADVSTGVSGVPLGFGVSGSSVGSGVGGAGVGKGVAGAVVATDGVGSSVGGAVFSGDGVGSTSHRNAPADDGGPGSTDRLEVSSSGMSSSKLKWCDLPWERREGQGSD